jgi:hypothetical protein
MKGWRRFVGVVFHSLGVSCVLGVFFAYFLMFFDILTQGIFRAVEPNLVVACLEVLVGCFGLVYFWFVLRRKKVFRRKKVGDV